MTASRLQANEAVLVVVDMQEKLVPTIPEAPRIIPRIGLLVRAAETLEIPILMTTQYAKGLGPTDPRVASMAPAVKPIDKITFSCFGSEEFKQALSATGRRSLILCGVESHICVLQTGLDALAEGRPVFLVTDATSSYDAVSSSLGQRRLEKAGCVLTTAEMTIFELMGASGTAAFKSLLPSLTLARNNQEAP